MSDVKSVSFAFSRDRVNLESFSLLNVFYLALYFSIGFIRRCWAAVLIVVGLSWLLAYALSVPFPDFDRISLVSHELLESWGRVLMVPQLWGQVVYDVVTKPVMIGVLMLALAHLNDQKPKFRSLLVYYGWKRLWPIWQIALPASLLKQIVILGGIILANQDFQYGTTLVVLVSLLLGGWIGMIAVLTLLRYFSADEGSVLTALQWTWARLQGRFWMLILFLFLSYAFVMTLALATFFVGLIWLVPAFFLATAIFFRYLSSDDALSKGK